MAFPSPLHKKAGIAQTTSEPFMPLPLTSHIFPSFYERDGNFDLTASLSSSVLSLIGDKVGLPQG